MTELPMVRDYMDTVVHTLSVDDEILSAVNVLLEKRVTGAPVIDDKRRVIGFLSEKDCLKLLAVGVNNDTPSGTVGDFMSTEVRCIPVTMNIYFAAGMFLSDHVRRFPVVEGDDILVGAITRFDILRAIQKNLK
jgi:predicted transcriptional regulator